MVVSKIVSIFVSSIFINPLFITNNMVNLLTFFKEHFDTERISDDNMKKFSEDHLNRLIANNTNGQYDVLIANLQPLYNTFKNSIATESFEYAKQQASTVTTDKIMADFKKMVSQKEGIIRGNWGVESAEYQLFFPQGLTEYHTSNKANIEELMDRLVMACQAYSQDLGTIFVNTFVTLRDDYVAARANQLQQIGKVTSNKSGTEGARKALAKQLNVNVLTLALEFLGQPERGIDFFDQSIIRSEVAKSNEPIIYEKTVAAKSITSVEQVMSASDVYEISNQGNVEILVGLADTPNDSPISPAALSANSTMIQTASQMGFINGQIKYLNLVNEDANNSASIRVEKIE